MTDPWPRGGGGNLGLTWVLSDIPRDMCGASASPDACMGLPLYFSYL